MTDMLDDPADMTPSQRRSEVAAILARGVLRLRQCREQSPGVAQSCTIGNDSESGQDCLDEGAETSPHASAG